MAWIPSVDTPDASIVGNGTPISQFEKKYYVDSTTSPTIWNPENGSSAAKRLVGVSKFTANAEADEIKYYDGFDELGSKQGRKTSSLEIQMEDRTDLQTIKKYENQNVWYIEAIGDDRDLTNDDGTYRYSVLKAYYGKLVKFTYDTSDLQTVTGTGSHNTALQKTIYAEITPVTVEISGTDNDATSGGPAESYSIVLKDIYGTTIDGSDLDAVSLAGEIESITIEKVSGTPTISVSASTDDVTKSVTFTGTGECVVRAKVVCKSSGVWYSSSKTVTVA